MNKVFKKYPRWGYSFGRQRYTKFPTNLLCYVLEWCTYLLIVPYVIIIERKNEIRNN